ncbi:hypothetical protein FRC10_007919 [Ceratobasidium sp. 414]|nr:hypothetical protein FRC10_007919 [Ceratobasidium sp. 414]
MDWNVVARQLLAGQGTPYNGQSTRNYTNQWLNIGSATRAPGAGPAATTGRALTLPPELSALPPQLVAALLNTLASNSAEPEPELDLNPNSDANRRTRMVFKFGERPAGTAGRGEFNIQDSLELDDDNYDLILRTVRQICVLCHFDMDLAITKQHPDKVVRARAKIRKAFPGLTPFNECKVPYWPINGLLLVVMKASSQGAQRRERRRMRERAANAHSTPNPVVPVAPVTPAGDNNDEDEDEDTVGNMTMASVKELDGMDGDETDEDSSDDEKADDATPLDPPAYNPDPVPTAPVAAPAAPRTTCKTTPAATANSRASSLAPAAPINTPASTPNIATPVSVNPPAPVSNSRGGRRRRRATAETASTPATIAPTSTTIVATAIAAPGTTNTVVQAQASATTGLPLNLADASHLAWLPASKRPPIPPTPGLTDTPAIPAAKLKKGSGAVSTTPSTEAAQPTSSSKSKAKSKRTPEPAADPEAMGLSGPESEPVAKVTRRRGKGAASGAALQQDQQKPADKKSTKAKAASSSVTAAGEVAPKAKTKKK